LWGEAATAGFAGTRARGGGFIVQPRGLGVRARGAAQAEAVPQPGSSLRMSPSGGTCLSARERRERRGGGWTGPAGPRGSEEKKRKAGWAGPCGRKEREGAGQAGLGCVGKRKEEEEDGLGQEEKEREREKEMHSNTFEFEFEI
jgi:hypothetical protein